jgi:hypothetical protein
VIAKAALLTQIVKVDEQAKMAALSRAQPDVSAPYVSVSSEAGQTHQKP